MNALYNNNYTNNLRILLINNAGGEIFSNIKGLSMTDRDKQFIVAPHNFNVKGIATDCHLHIFMQMMKNHLTIISKKFLKEILNNLLSLK